MALSRTIQPRPTTAREALDKAIPAFTPGAKPNLHQNQRAEEISLKDTKFKDYSIDFEDIDSAVLFYFENVIKPYVIEDGSRVTVPIRFANQERWKSSQKDGAFKDKDGKMLFPVIVLKRDNVEKNRSIGSKLDGNQAHNYHIFEQKYSTKNRYSNFSALTNRVPVKQYSMVVVPDYCNITYSCAVYVNYQEDLNKVLEGIMFASDSYWGDPKRFTFMTRIDNMPITQELVTGEDRKIYSVFNLMLNGHVIPDSINKYMATQKHFLSKSQVIFSTEVVGKNGSGREITSATANNSTKVTFPERIIKNNNQLSTDTALYLATVHSHKAAPEDISTDRFYIRGVNILPAPQGLPATTKDNFYVFINGQYIDQSEILSIEQDGTDVLVIFDNTDLGYSLDSTDEIEIKGKFES